MDDAELKRLAEAALAAGDDMLAHPSGVLRLLRERDDARADYEEMRHQRDGSSRNYLIADSNARKHFAVAIQLRKERDEARARLASAQHDVEVYRDAVIEAREHGRVLAKDRDCASAGEDLLAIFEDLHGLPGEGEGA